MFLDTNSVNFAIGKLSSAWQSTAPSIQNASAQYVKFTVWKTIAEFPCWILATIFLTIIFFFLYKMRDEWDDLAPIGMVIVGIGAMFCLLGIVVSGYEMACAIACPDMYTIHQIISEAKK